MDIVTYRYLPGYAPVTQSAPAKADFTDSEKIGLLLLLAWAIVTWE